MIQSGAGSCPEAPVAEGGTRQVLRRGEPTGLVPPGCGGKGQPPAPIKKITYSEMLSEGKKFLTEIKSGDIYYISIPIIFEIDEYYSF